MKRLFIRLWNKPELRIFLKFTIFTVFSNIIGLGLRYWLLSGGGVHRFFGYTVTVSDNAAYIVFYVVGVVLLYLLKWLHADGIQGSSFVPRLLGFIALNTVSMLAGNAFLTFLTGSCGLGEELAFWLTCPFTFVINYLGTRLIVFCDTENRESKRILESSQAEQQ